MAGESRVMDGVSRTIPKVPSKFALAQLQRAIHHTRSLLASGKLSAACESAATAQTYAPPDAGVWNTLGSLFSLANNQERALIAYDRAVVLAPDNAQYLFNRAAVQRFLGKLAAAEADYDRAIILNPVDYEAYKSRTDLRTQTAHRNHIVELDALLAKGTSDWRGAVQLRFALAKEYEDLGQYDRSFQHLALGARQRRDHLQYAIQTDILTVDWIIAAYPMGTLVAQPNSSQESPIFIIGLPRSGTTLVDRILGSHSALVSAGELNYFAGALVDAVTKQNAQTKLLREELVAQSAQLDFSALGLDYLARCRDAGITNSRFTDKMPLNYLYCGLIHRALPRAKIVQLIRHPMAVCYAMYKTLFQDGYPFSYDLSEIGLYYIGYQRLMAHWSLTLPGVMHQVHYEDLVEQQKRETAKLLQFCALPWEEACMDYHQSSAVTTTASAAQVRQPMYSSSVSQWRHYAKQLEPLRRQLEASGIDCT